MAKYLDPKADLTFKKIFGEHKHLVISLLNALLPLKDDERVESIEYWPAEKGMNYASLQPVYALNFVNAEFQKEVDDYYHYYHLVHDRYTDKVIDGLHLIFVELPKFKPSNYAEKKMQVLWLRFLTESPVSRQSKLAHYNNQGIVISYSLCQE